MLIYLSASIFLKYVKECEKCGCIALRQTAVLQVGLINFNLKEMRCQLAGEQIFYFLKGVILVLESKH